MPPKKAKPASKPKERTSEEDMQITPVDVQYNPDIIDGMLQDLNVDVETRCQQMQKEIEFMISSIQQAFQLELIKLPTQVKQMSLSKFKQEFGDSLESVTKTSIAGTAVKAPAVPQSAAKSRRPNISVFQTPSNHSKTSSLLGNQTVLRAPHEGETILSTNGSPLGQFVTAVKAPRNKPGLAPPQTPGFLTLGTGDVVAIDDVEKLPETLRDDALVKMQAMMENMQAMMLKIKQQPAGSKTTKTAVL